MSASKVEVIETEHWGEYTHPMEFQDDGISEEEKKLLCEGAFNMDSEPAPEANENANAYAIKLPAEIGAMNETMLHSILLQPYIQTMQTLIKEARESSEIDDMNPPTVPPVPEKPPVVQRLPMVPLSEENVSYLRRKSCSTILAHEGFTTAKTSALDVLCDVLDDFLTRFMSRIRVAVDQTARSGPQGFAYPLFRAFTEMDIDPLSLREYYIKKVLKRNEILLKTAQHLHLEYTNLVNSKIREVLEGKRELEEENIPELHFPALGEEQLQSSLEPGFQMLDSLEHDESLQNMEPDVEVVVNDSPSHEYVLSTSSDFSSFTESQTKMKKRKVT